MKDLTVPLKLIGILSDGEFHSGEQLGELFGMSRAGIGKHLQTVREWGVDIFTVPGKGYCLPGPMQLLDEKRITQALPQHNIAVLPVIDSTNQYLSERSGKLKSGDACVAEYQQAGRGRRGRQWFSPFGTNLYLSMFWRLEQGPSAAVGLSLVVGIVIAEVLQRLGASEVKVKWPNDLYLHDRKLAGILVELSGKAGDVANVVIGAGINLLMKTPDPSVVNQSWINLQEAEISIDRNQLVIEILDSLYQALTLFELQGFKAFKARWNALDNFINRPVKLLIGEKVIHGIAHGINETGGLLLEQDGQMTAFVGGEISLRADD